MRNYGHWFEQQGDCPLGAWVAITRDFKVLVDHLQAVRQHTRSGPGHWLSHAVCLSTGLGGEGDPPLITEDIIVFNGVRGLIDLTGEMMIVHKLQPDAPRHLGSCVTEGKPYDLAVCALLLLMDLHAPGCWLIKSVGGYPEWDPALLLVERQLRYYPSPAWLE